MDIAAMKYRYALTRPMRAAVGHSLTHDWSLRAWLHYGVGAAVMAAIIGGLSYVNNLRPDAVLPFNAERTVTVYGRVMDIHIQGDREVPVCAGSRIKRRLVLYAQGNSRSVNNPEYIMDIPDDNVVVFREGALDTHLLVDLPVAPKPGTHWEYQPTPVDGCAWWTKFVPWYHSIKQSQGPSTPVIVEDKPSQILARDLPFIPRALLVTPTSQDNTPYTP